MDNVCSFGLYPNESPRQKIEDTAKEESNNSAAHDDDVVWHAEIGGRKIDQEVAGIKPSFGFIRTINR